MSEKYDVVVTQQKKRNKGLYAAATAVAVTALAPVASNAALAEIGAELSTEMEAGKLIIVAIMTLGATLLAMFAGYRYMKRGANSA